MIITMTTNPSIDYYADMAQLPVIGQINRTGDAHMIPGGKGVNVAIVLNRLGVAATAMGFAAGKTGTMFQSLLSEEGCPSDFLMLDEGETRINVKLGYEGGETAFNGAGPDIPPAACRQLLSRLENLTRGDYLILSGNLQKSIPDFYSQVAASAMGRGARVIIDTAGPALKRALELQPFLIKPNLDEFNELTGTKTETPEQAVKNARPIIEAGAENVMISMGDQGAVLVCRDGRAYKARSQQIGKVYSTVGAGDCAVAGFIHAYIRSRHPGEALRSAVAAGTASVHERGLATQDGYLTCLQRTELSILGE